MMPQLIDRRRLKADTRELLRSAQVNPKAMTALYLILILVMNLADSLSGGMGSNLVGTFVSVLAFLLTSVLEAGFALYCMAVRQGQRAEFVTLFDGFSFVGKVIGLSLLRTLFIVLWSMLFVIPGIVASYRYRFAMYNLCEDPELSILEAMEMSKQQTMGYKGQLFVLDLSYLGWGVLSSLPSLIQVGYLYFLVLQDPYTYMANPEALLSAEAFSLAVSVGTWVWAIAVQLFYLPHYQCVELGYFDIAKRTSGVGAGTRTPDQDEWNGWNGGNDRPGGPDDLGGY